MVIGMTRGYVDFMYKGKVVRGWGDMGGKYFYIIASTIEWIFPGKRHRLNDMERDEFIDEVKRCEYQSREEYRMAFEDDNGKMIKKKIKKEKRRSKKEIKNSRLKAKSIEDLDWDFYKKIILRAKNEVNMFEREGMFDNNRKYILLKEAIAEHISLITVNKYLRILGTSDSIYEDAIKFSDLIKTICKEEKNIIAYDIFGGLFAKEEVSLGKEIHYLAPDSLEWEETEIAYSEFVEWAINGNVNEFYQPFLWDGFYEDVSKLSPEEGIMFYPPIWTKDFDMNASCKKTVFIKDILAAKQSDGSKDK